MLNPTEEAKFKDLRDKCRELKIPMMPEVFIGLKVHDKSGVLTLDDIQRGHSWTRNFYNFLYSQSTWVGASAASYGVGYISSKDVSGNIGSSADYALQAVAHTLAGNHWQYNAAASTYGIQVGTSDTAFSAEHYTMQALIAHGTGAGQLSYAAMSAASKAYNAGTDTWTTTHTRVFNNNSAGSITVKEVGLVAYLRTFSASGSNYCLMERSVLDPTVAVAVGAQLTVTYTISLDFAAIDA